MKTKLFILLAICCFFAVYHIKAQAYIPFIKEGKMWTELITSGVDTNNKTIAVFTMTEDTFFNSKVYKKIIYNQANYYYVHEDTQNKKIYVYDSFFSKDTLWYDFSLQTGDTLNVGCTSLILVNKSIEYFAGSNRNKLEFSWDIGNPVVLTWYEGIGDIYGVFWPLCFTGSGYRLLCYFENDTLLYHNLGLNDSCFTLTSVNTLQPEKLFNSYLYNHILYVKCNKPVSYTLSIYDIFGRIIKETTATGNIEVNLSALQRGLYIYKIESSDMHYYYTGKLVLNQ